MHEEPEILPDAESQSALRTTGWPSVHVIVTVVVVVSLVRCSERRFFLRPDEDTNNSFIY